MTTLLQQLDTFDGAAITLPNGDTISFSSIVSKSNVLREEIKAVATKSVDALVNNSHQNDAETKDRELPFSSLTEFVIGLLALEGWVEEFSILSDRFIYSPPSTLGEKSAVNSTWFLFTSGTTGKPKQIAHTTKSICASLRLRGHSKQSCWALTYKPSKFAGIQVILQSLLSGDCLVDCSSGSPDEKVALLKETKASAISATPSWWRQLLMTNSIDSLNLTHITLGGETADQHLLSTLSTCFPSAKIFHIYASTEAGVGFAVSDNKAGFPKSWVENGVNRNYLRIKQNILWIKPWFDATRLNNAGAIECDDEGYINTQDVVLVEGERVFFKGRLNGTINVGGHKVFPETVESVLLSSPLVAQARVYGKENKILGSVVVADIVLSKPPANADNKKIKLSILLYCKTHLDRKDMPTKINVVDTLALSDSGKLVRATS